MLLFKHNIEESVHTFNPKRLKSSGEQVETLCVFILTIIWLQIAQLELFFKIPKVCKLGPRPKVTL